MSHPLQQKTMRNLPAPNGRRASIVGKRKQRLWILVMGLTGAGKSTFISTITENRDIVIGAPSQMDGVTQDVQEYILLYSTRDVLYEIHLVDTPGFDDGNVVDSEILSKIADFVNLTYALKQRLAGVLYLHDMTREKMGSVGKLNLRMLEQMIGIDRFNNCTFVTTKWGCSEYNRQVERETTLRKTKEYFGEMLEGPRKASMVRFEPSSKGRALEIVRPFLNRKFVTHISEEMVDQHAALGDTSSGKIVADNLEKLAKYEKSLAEKELARLTLAKKWDEQVFHDFKKKRDDLRRKHKMNQAGRWIMRTGIIGGAITATVLTLGPGASAFVLAPAYEKVARTQKSSEREARRQLEQDFLRESALGEKLKGKNALWLRSKEVDQLTDLDDDRFSTIGGDRNDEILAAAAVGATVGVEGEALPDLVEVGDQIPEYDEASTNDEDEDEDDDDQKSIHQ